MDLYAVASLLLLPTILLMVTAQWLVKSTFNKYARLGTLSDLTGAQAAEKIMQIEGVLGVTIQEGRGFLTDHYNPIKKSLVLSPQVYRSKSIAAIGVASHEAGHAIQHKKGYFFLHIRSILVPSAKIGSILGPLLLMIGLLFQLLNLINLGILFFTLSVIFTFITLPVEFDASTRALKLLSSGNILTENEQQGARHVLQAAALTYVASALMSVIQLLRFIGLSQRRRN